MDTYMNALANANLTGKNSRNLYKVLKEIDAHPNISYELLATTTELSLTSIYRLTRILKDAGILKNKAALFVNRDILTNFELKKPIPEIPLAKVGKMCLENPVVALQMQEHLLTLDVDLQLMWNAIALYALHTGQFEAFQHVDAPKINAGVDVIFNEMKDVLNSSGLVKNRSHSDGVT